MERSKKSLMREKERNSEEMQDFRNQIEIFFNKTGLREAVQYKLKVDLGCMTNMPYYGIAKGSRHRILPLDAITECCFALIDYNNLSFAEKLLSWLTKQQNQSFRKISPIPKAQKERKKQLGSNATWEHPIPLKVSRTIIIDYIKAKNRDGIKDYLKYLSEVPQIALPIELDNQLTKAGLKYNMPNGWNWKDPDSKFKRYLSIGINLSEVLC